MHLKGLYYYWVSTETRTNKKLACKITHQGHFFFFFFYSKTRTNLHIRFCISRSSNHEYPWFKKKILYQCVLLMHRVYSFRYKVPANLRCFNITTTTVKPQICQTSSDEGQDQTYRGMEIVISHGILYSIILNTVLTHCFQTLLGSVFFLLLF